MKTFCRALSLSVAITAFFLSPVAGQDPVGSVVATFESSYHSVPLSAASFSGLSAQMIEVKVTDSSKHLASTALVDLTGNWAGEIRIPFFEGRARGALMVARLTQTGNSLSGTIWANEAKNFSPGWIVSGTITETSLFFTAAFGGLEDVTIFNPSGQPIGVLRSTLANQTVEFQITRILELPGQQTQIFGTIMIPGLGIVGKTSWGRVTGCTVPPNGSLVPVDFIPKEPPLDGCPPLDSQDNPDFSNCLPGSRDFNGDGTQDCLFNELADDEGNSFQLWCMENEIQDDDNFFWYGLFYTATGDSPKFAGKCPFGSGVNLGFLYHTGDGDSSGKPDCFIGSGWDSFDGGTDDPNSLPGQDRWTYSFDTAFRLTASRHLTSTGSLAETDIRDPGPVFNNLPPVLNLEEIPAGGLMVPDERALCDIDQDGDCDADDQQVFDAALGKCLGQTGYIREADLDFSGCVTLGDLEVLPPVHDDDDNDNVADNDDFCPETLIPEATVPSVRLGTNRWALVDDDFDFDTTPPKGKGPMRSYNTTETGGCSCEQIIEAQGLGNGHTKFGCSISAMDDWVAIVAGAPKRGAGADVASVPETFVLEGNYPNPFNPETVIRFEMPEGAYVRLVVYNAMGREVARLVDQPMSAGTYSVTWDASGLPSGTYLYRLTAGPFSQTKAMILLK